MTLLLSQQRYLSAYSRLFLTSFTVSPLSAPRPGKLATVAPRGSYSTLPRGTPVASSPAGLRAGCCATLRSACSARHRRATPFRLAPARSARLRFCGTLTSHPAPLAFARYRTLLSAALLEVGRGSFLPPRSVARKNNRLSVRAALWGAPGAQRNPCCFCTRWPAGACACSLRTTAGVPPFPPPSTPVAAAVLPRFARPHAAGSPSGRPSATRPFTAIAGRATPTPEKISLDNVRTPSVHSLRGLISATLNMEVLFHDKPQHAHKPRPHAQRKPSLVFLYPLPTARLFPPLPTPHLQPIPNRSPPTHTRDHDHRQPLPTNQRNGLRHLPPPVHNRLAPRTLWPRLSRHNLPTPISHEMSMAYRASLTGCIRYMGDVWRTAQYEYLSIICYPAAKYYAVVTDDELENPQYDPEHGKQRLVLRCTFHELAIITKHANLDLWKDAPDERPENDRTHGQQPDGDPTP